jgi:outer membrane protein assembly factor BamB
LTGEERWRGGDAQISYASPSIMTIQGVEQIVMVNESTVTGHDPKTGSVLWSHDWPGQSYGKATVSQAVWVDASHVLLSKGYGGGAEMLDFTNSTPPDFVAKSKWKNKALLKTKFTTAVCRDGYLYGLSDGILECVEAETGKQMWKDSRNGRIGHGQLLLVRNHLLISSEDGRCILGRVDHRSFQRIGELQVLRGITWNTIAIAGDRMLMRNGEEAACVELPTVGTNRPTEPPE